MLVQGNQQATRSWFTGILEGEGSFGRSKSGSAYIEIPNTDLGIIEGCESFLKTNNIWAVRDTIDRKGYKRSYRIRVTNSGREVFQYATLLYELIAPSLDCRHDEYQRILGASTTPRDPAVDLDWLAGIYEAEGSFSLTRDCRGGAALAISVNNTNTRIIDKVLKNLKMIRCGCHIRVKSKPKAYYKDARIVAICGILRCQTFLRKMRGRWVSLRHQKIASNILAFADSRLTHSRKDPYSEYELRLIQSTIDLNG